MCSLVTHTVQINPSIHIYLISDIIELKCVKIHDSRIDKEPLFNVAYNVTDNISS